MISPRTRTRLYAAATLALAASAPPLLAADYYFVGPSGSAYSNPANWSASPTGPGGSAPGPLDAATVQPTAAGDFTLSLDAAPNTGGGVATANFIGSNVTGGSVVVNTPPSAATIFTDRFHVGPNVTLNLSAGGLRANGQSDLSGPGTTVNLSGAGSLAATMGLNFNDGVAVQQSGGSVNSSNGVTIGGAGAHAVSYAISGGTLGGDDVYLNGAAPVTLTQTGGAVGANYSVSVGQNSTYSLVAGAVITYLDPVRVGYYSNVTGNYPTDTGATFSQSGGTVTVTRDLSPGADGLIVNANPSGAPALYTMSGGSLLFPGRSVMVVGDTAAGTFAQSGGAIGTASPNPDSSAPNAVYLGRAAGAAGTYSLSGTAVLNTRALHVGYAGSGTLVQTGGTLNVLNTAGPLFSLATNPGSSATYLLSGGTVSFSQTPSTFTVADAGTASVTQTGGTFGASGSRGGNVTTPTYLYLAKSAGSAASYSLSGTDSTLYAGYEYVGNSGAATFSQSGGNHYAQSVLYVGYNAGSTGTYNLSGGRLDANDIHVAESGTATFILSGGTAVTNALSAAVNAGASATLNLTGGTLTVSPPNPIGNVRLGYHGTATINHSGGTLDTSRNLVITTLGAGSTYSLSGTGALRPYHLFVGEQGPAASFTQSGGTNTITSTLALANSPGSSATYTLTGGSVSADTLSVGPAGSATFAQYGGSASFPNGITIGGGDGPSKYTVGPTGPNPPPHSSSPYFSTNSITLDGPNPSSFVMNDGTGVVNGPLLVGRNASFSYASSGSTLMVYGPILVGGTPAGAPASYPSDAGATFTQNFGYGLYAGVNVNPGTDAITVNANPGSSATFNLKGGNLYFPGGNTNLTVGSTTNGTFNQTGGWISPPTVFNGQAFPNTPNLITLGKAAGATGTYLLSGNNASVGATEVRIGDAGSGSFLQSGGGAAFPTLRLAMSAGSTGTYSLSGTGSLSTTTLTVAYAGTGSFAQSGGTLTAGGVSVGALIGSRGAYALSAGLLSATSEWVGVAGTATFTHTGGTNSVAASLTIGNTNADETAAGTYALSDAGRLTVGDSVFVGLGTAGTFVQSGGAHSVANALYLGYNVGRRGTYDLSAGTLAAANEYVGYRGVGSFAQTGGTNSVSAGLTLGYAAGATGTYALSGTGELDNPSAVGKLTVGDAGAGTFAQSGGTASMSRVILGNAATGTGTFTQSGGTFTNGGTIIGASGTGTLSLTAGRYLATGTLYLGQSAGATGSLTIGGPDARFSATQGQYVGYAGAGQVTQTDGSNYSADPLYLGYLAGANGSYSLAGGTASFDYVNVGVKGNGTFAQTGGSLSTNALRVSPQAGASASYALTGGSLTTVGESSFIGGDAGAATFTHSGGTFSTGSNFLSVLANARYALSGTGTLTTERLSVTGTFTQSGGTRTAADATSVFGAVSQSGGSATAGLLTVNPSAVYDLTGGALTANSVNNDGTFYMGPGASFALTGTTFTNTGSATFDGTQSWRAGSTFSNTLVAFFHSDPGSPTNAPLNVTSASPDWAPVVFDAPTTHLASLVLSSATHASLPTASPAGAARLLSTRALSITDTARLDLANNTLVVDYGTAAPSPADTIRQYLLTSHLTSLMADATHRLGYLDSGTALTVRLTLAGDANLDGKLDADDYTLLDKGFAQHASTWWQGDFNYDGQVTSADYLLLDSTYGQSHGLSPDLLTQRKQQFGPDYVSQLLTSVPEPSSLACLFAALPPPHPPPHKILIFILTSTEYNHTLRCPLPVGGRRCISPIFDK